MKLNVDVEKLSQEIVPAVRHYQNLWAQNKIRQTYQKGVAFPEFPETIKKHFVWREVWAFRYGASGEYGSPPVILIFVKLAKEELMCGNFNLTNVDEQTAAVGADNIPFSIPIHKRFLRRLVTIWIR